MNKKLKLSSVIFILSVLCFTALTHSCQRFIFNSAHAETQYKNKTLILALSPSFTKNHLNYQLLQQFLNEYHIQYKIKKIVSTEDLKNKLATKTIDLAISNSVGPMMNLTWKIIGYVGPQSEDFDTKSLILFSNEHKSLAQLFESWFNQQLDNNKLFSLKIDWTARKFNITTEQYKNILFDIDQSLPNYTNDFKKYGKKYEIPWTLLAAVAYQESKWKSEARSYTGVRGLMQITEKTAQFLGIKDRTDPEESIKGAAIYLNYLYHKTSPKLSSTQRWAKTLAAYNIGWGHMLDLKQWAKANNKSFESWEEIKKILPLKQNLEFSHQLKRGYARGNETVHFVENVHLYYKILNDYFIDDLQKNQKWPPLTTVAMVRPSIR